MGTRKRKVMEQPAQAQPTDSQAELKRKARRIHNLLLKQYGAPAWHRLDGVSELVSTILSQNTNDGNRDLAYARLRARFKTWEAVRDAEPAEVIEAIRPAGLANQKGPRIQAALRRISEARGELNIDFLRDLPPQEARAWLTGIKGVGPKTAAIVLLFCYDMPLFPVDTHVHRVAGRLGLIGPKVTAEHAHTVMEQLCPPGQHGAFHLNLIRHGRELCHARRPECERCPLQGECDDYARRRGGENPGSLSKR
ncbi:MAG: endonuclease III [Anaerolineae bacterium]|nr:endonuclease III [Thermoflexales bacterium]MDW8406585.1 endonuclease III [Anaerolineae bacterium]